MKNKILSVSKNYEDIPEIKRLEDFYNQEKHRALFKKRGILNEPTHSHIFNNNGIFKLHCIDNDKINGEIAMLIMIDTLKKVWKHHDPGLFICVLLIICWILSKKIVIKR